MHTVAAVTSQFSSTLPTVASVDDAPSCLELGRRAAASCASGARGRMVVGDPARLRPRAAVPDQRRRRAGLRSASCVRGPAPAAGRRRDVDAVPGRRGTVQHLSAALPPPPRAVDCRGPPARREVRRPSMRGAAADRGCARGPQSQLEAAASGTGRRVVETVRQERSEPDSQGGAIGPLLRVRPAAAARVVLRDLRRADARSRIRRRTTCGGSRPSSTPLVRERGSRSSRKARRRSAV